MRAEYMCGNVSEHVRQHLSDLQYELRNVWTNLSEHLCQHLPDLPYELRDLPSQYMCNVFHAMPTEYLPQNSVRHLYHVPHL